MMQSLGGFSGRFETDEWLHGIVEASGFV